MLSRVITALRSVRAPVAQSEPDLHALVASALTQAGLPFSHEAAVAPGCRVDFFVSGVGIEIKRARPNRQALLRQATRYLASPRVESLLLLCERDPGLPPFILGKPCAVLSLFALWGIAVPAGSAKAPAAALPPAPPQPLDNVIARPSPETPAYLQPIPETSRLYGTLSYLPRSRSWVIKGDPAVTEMAKRLFPGADSGKRGVARFTAHRRTVGELNWLMLRYPLAVMPEDRERWDQALEESRAHDRRLEQFRTSAPAYHDASGFFQGVLRPFQQFGASWLIHAGRALLADEMGLGKTVQSLAALAACGGFPALVVVPPHLVSNWESEINRFLSVDGRPPRVCVLRGLKPQPLPEADFYLVHYLLLRGWKDALPELPVNTVIFDEIQELRHGGTEKYSAASLLANACARVWGLSGTPIYNHGGEIWNVTNVLDYHLLGDWESFTREWCYGYGNAVVVHPDWLGEHLRREGLMLRRTKKDVLPELPDKRRLVQRVDADDALMSRLMQPIMDQLRAYAANPGDTLSQRALLEGSLSLKERQATGLAKAATVAQFVRALVESGEKVLLFAHHHAVMDAYKKELRRFSPAFLTGRETQAQKDAGVKRFMEGKTDLCCVSLRAAAGLNLQRATCVVFGELDWSPAVHSQAEDRAHRIGQKDSLLCYYLVSSGGSDAVMQDALGLKVSQFMGLMGELPQSEADVALSFSLARRHVEDMLRRWLPEADSPPSLP